MAPPKLPMPVVLPVSPKLPMPVLLPKLPMPVLLVGWLAPRPRALPAATEYSFRRQSQTTLQTCQCELPSAAGTRDPWCHFLSERQAAHDLNRVNTSNWTRFGICTVGRRQVCYRIHVERMLCASTIQLWIRATSCIVARSLLSTSLRVQRSPAPVPATPLPQSIPPLTPKANRLTHR